MALTPFERYQSDLTSGAIVPDAAQLRAVEALQDLYERLEVRAFDTPSFVRRLFGGART